MSENEEGGRREEERGSRVPTARVQEARSGVLDRREAIRRTAWMLGGVSLVGGSGLLAACESGARPSGAGYEPIGGKEEVEEGRELKERREEIAK